MPLDSIRIRGAREHNLKNIDIDIPRDKLVVITGLSGSGKSSLAFDTIFAEGQRRYVESLSAYARQFLGQMQKPDVDYIEGLSPAVSIDQKSTTKNPRSTVATVTEIYDYLRLLFARIGKPHCPNCGRPISQQTIEQIVDQVLSREAGSRFQILAPLVRGRKGEFRKEMEDIRRSGFSRIRVDKSVIDLTESDLPEMDRYKNHWIDVVVDRLILKPDIERRLADSLETSLKMGKGVVGVEFIGGEELVFSESFACVVCGVSLEEIAPRSFSFNSPYGACPECHGLGVHIEFDPDRLIPSPDLSINEGALVSLLARKGEAGYHEYTSALLNGLSKQYGLSLAIPFKKLPAKIKDILLYGSPEPVTITFRSRWGDNRARTYDADWPGVIKMMERRYQETSSEQIREDMEQYRTAHPCPACNGTRLKKESLAVTIGEMNIAQVAALSIEEADRLFNDLHLSARDELIAHQIIKEIRTRLGFLVNVGLSYLTLDRPAATLAGGEAQRIRLATQIGSGLMGVLYILDEPSIGLHQRDNFKLLATLQQLRDLGNTIIVVEHDEETMLAADHLIDIGPGAGEKGGRVVAHGTVQDVISTPESLTGQYLAGIREIKIPAMRRKPDSARITIVNARQNNLKNISVTFPLGVFICVTGLSGSGKSTLIQETLYPSLTNEINGTNHIYGAHDAIEGVDQIDKIVDIDQSPIGRTPRSNPATYTGTFDLVRELFSMTAEARARGYEPGRFSFNVKGGRCEACRGDGIIKIEMHLLPDVYVACEVCKGKRYNRETLEVEYKGKNIYDVLGMTVAEALEFFNPIPRIRRKLETLHDVGLDYIRLGQPATTLSGGEAQRVKLATELSRRSTGRTLYILDEPTTGLHFADIEKLLDILNRLVDAGNTVIVIEHNLDVIKTADYIIDLGPEGGDAGGRVVATGTPEEVAAVEGSYTGRFIRRMLQKQENRAVVAEKDGVALEASR